MGLERLLWSRAIATALVFHKELTQSEFNIHSSTNYINETENSDDNDKPNDYLGLLFRKAKKAIKDKDNLQAISVLKRLIELDESYPLPYILLGTCYMDLDQFQEALESYDRALFFDGKRASLSLELRKATLDMIKRLEKIPYEIRINPKLLSENISAAAKNRIESKAKSSSQKRTAHKQIGISQAPNKNINTSKSSALSQMSITPVIITANSTKGPLEQRGRKLKETGPKDLTEALKDIRAADEALPKTIKLFQEYGVSVPKFMLERYDYLKKTGKLK